MITDDPRRDPIEHLVTDRDAKSRTVEPRAIDADVQPDVDSNNRAAILGDEGPVAATNPHNQAEQ